LRKLPVREGSGSLGVRVSIDTNTLNAMRSRSPVAAEKQHGA
jgi:hypothetical protein